MFSCFAELGFYRGARRREGKGREGKGGKLDMEDKEAIPDGLSLEPGNTSPAMISLERLSKGEAGCATSRTRTPLMFP